MEGEALQVKKSLLKYDINLSYLDSNKVILIEKEKKTWKSELQRLKKNSENWLTGKIYKWGINCNVGFLAPWRFTIWRWRRWKTNPF